MRTLSLVAIFAVAAVCLCEFPAAGGDTDRAKISTEMRDFMKRLDGTEKSVNGALLKYAAAGVSTSAMDGIRVREPKVTATEVKDGMTCYKMACKTGILDRVYLVCWKDKKIQKLKQLSAK